MSQKVNNACKNLPGFLCMRMWISTTIFGMNFAVRNLLHFLTLKAEGEGEREKGRKENKEKKINFHVITEYCVPSATDAYSVLTASPPRRGSCLHFTNWEMET